MPVHDWTRVDAGIFRDFHTVWIGGIRSAMNEGLLPEGYYALAEAAPRVRRKQTLRTGALTRSRTLAIRHVSGHRLVAMLEILSPANKDRARLVPTTPGECTASSWNSLSNSTSRTICRWTNH